MKKQKLILLAALVTLVAGGFAYKLVTPSSKPKASNGVLSRKILASNICSNNTDAKKIIVSVSQRRLWTCEGENKTYDSTIVTGDMNIPADLTPAGTYKIYAKQTDRTLAGSDAKGSWNVHVNYWMPFLDNQYGTYGFHDATWRQEKDFGNVDPYSSDASHGCVELPLTTAKWLYYWAPVSTPVTVET